MRNFAKKFVTIGLSAVVMAGCCSSVSFAAELTQDNPSGGSIVTYSESGGYTATIPSFIKAEEIGKQNTSAYSVSVNQAVIPTGETLSAIVSYDGMLETEDGAAVPYRLYTDAGAIESGAQILSRSAGEEGTTTAFFGAALTDKVKYSGNYFDTATFSFSIAKNYTLDEINADEHLLPIGKTKPEYVVAKFNDDFTSVEIFKNGPNSDGLMKDFDFGSGVYTITGASADTIESVVITDGVASIGNSAFSGCKHLTNVSIPNSVTSVGERTFEGCAGMTAISLPNSIASIGMQAFYDSGLTSIVIPDSVTKLGGFALAYCENMENVIFSKNLTTIEQGMCTSQGGSKLKTVTIPEGITTIENNAFANNNNLQSVIIPDSVNSIKYAAFANCSALSSITIPKGVTGIETQTFDGCRSLVDVSLPDTLTSIGERAFGSCKALTNLVIPNGVTELGEAAFEECEKLNTVVIPESVTNIGNYAFYNCSALSNVTIPSGVRTIGDYAFKYCTYLAENFIIPEGVTSIGKEAFFGCNSLKNVSLPESMTSIADGAFQSSDKKVNEMFFVKAGSYSEMWAKNNNYNYTTEKCMDKYGNIISSDGSVLIEIADKNATTYTIPDSIKTIGDNVFAGCSNLKSIIIPSSVTSIGNSAFKDCSSLTSIIIPNSVTNIGDSAFDGCTAASVVTVPESVTSIGTNAFDSVGEYASVTGEAAKILVKSGSYAETWAKTTGTAYRTDAYLDETGVVFTNDRNTLVKFSAGNIMTEYTIPTSVSTIEDGAFAFCTGLKKVVVPQGITNIGSYTFVGCTALTDVVLPDSITTIGEGAFAYCSSLQNITIPDSVTVIGDYAFICDDDGNVNVTFHVKAGSYAETWAKNNGYTFVAK